MLSLAWLWWKPAGNSFVICDGIKLSAENPCSWAGAQSVAPLGQPCECWMVTLGQLCRDFHLMGLHETTCSLVTKLEAWFCISSLALLLRPEACMEWSDAVWAGHQEWCDLPAELGVGSLPQQFPVLELSHCQCLLRYMHLGCRNVIKLWDCRGPQSAQNCLSPWYFSL